MISHDPVRTRLRDSLERSAVGLFLRGARAQWADAWVHARMPSKVEIRGLEQRGNECDDWASVRLLGTGSLAGIRGCRFEGHSVLRLGSMPGQGPTLRDSLIRNCLLGVCTVEAVAVLDRMIVEHGAVLRHIGACTGTPDSRFCLGLAAHPGSETGARRVFLCDGLHLDDCAAMAALAPEEQEALAHEWTARLKPCVSDYAFVGAGAHVEHTRFVENCFVGAGTRIRGAASVRGSVLTAAPEGDATRAVTIGDGVIVEDCVLEAGVHLDSMAQVRRSLFLECSGAEQGGHVAESVIGPNTHVAKGEVTASLVGPFVGFHHQALLIGTLWPEGRGNVGYGANVGSNHTGRKPDQELKPGEGVFFGLSCAIKFPADFSESPYSLFATGVTTPPQKISFPFSLITTSTTTPSANEIMPGWMWGENAYALIRNAYKYSDRNAARDHSVPALPAPPGSPLAGTFLASDLFAQGVSKHVLKAFEVLAGIENAAVHTVYTAKELPGLGANVVHAARIKKARAAYAQYLAFLQCRIALWNPEGNPAATLAAKNALVALEVSEEQNFEVGHLFATFLESVENSLAKDTARGQEVFGDYATFHPGVTDDPVCLRLRAELQALEPVLRARLG